MSPRRTRPAGFVLAVVGALVLLGGAPAWAAPELRLEPATGQPGDSFTVTGTGFEPGPVDIHWDSESGPHLTTTVGPEFTVTVVVPADAQPNSYPVVAVVRNGSSLSTSTASFQVGPVAEPDEPEEPEEPGSTTTVAESPPVTDPPPAGRGASAGDASRNALGVTGGVDPDMAGTTNGGTAGQSTVGSGPDSDGATPGAAAEGAEGEPGSTTTTAAPPAGGPPEPGPGSLPSSGAPGSAPGGDAEEAEGAALAPRPTSQSSGAVQSPVLLVLGLGMVFGGGVVLAVRNRHRTGA
ncbi:MAG: hypothetical protein ACRD1D_15680 [Acidimicrobiales bacterium]